MIQWTFQLSDTRANKLDVVLYGLDYDEVMEKLDKLGIPCIGDSTCLVNVLELKDQSIKTDETA